MHVNSRDRTTPAIVTATPTAARRALATYAAPRHNGGHFLIEPSNSSRARSRPAANLLILSAAMQSRMRMRRAMQTDACRSSGMLPDHRRRRRWSEAASCIALCPSERLLQLVRNLRPRHSEVQKLPLAHGGELAMNPRVLSPEPHELRQLAPDRCDPRRPNRKAPAGRPDRAQAVQLAALAGACGNGPSAFSVRTESQYSRISLILPSSRRNTRQ